MKEDFVTYEIAKKMKDNGFKGKCLYNYRNNGFLMPNYVHPINGEFVSDGAYCCCNDLFTDYTCDAPTISQALKWLREEKKLYIVMDITRAYPSCNILYWGFIVFDVLNGDIIYFEHNRDSYEQAALAGIEYVLDNIIKEDQP